MRKLAVGLIVGAVLGWPLPTINDIDQPVAIDVISAADFADSTITDIAELMKSVPNVASYRFGDNPSGVATLIRDVAPAATPDLIGAVVLRSGSAGFDRLGSAVRDSATQYYESGLGLVDTKDYLFFIATRDLPATPTVTSGLAAQIEFPIGFADKTGWVAQAQYPGDTWQGASLVLSSQLGIDGTYQASLIDVAQGFQPVPFDGLFATGPDWAIAAVNWDTLDAFSSSPLSWGFASHVHDGSFGSCADCASIVTAYPEVPRTVADLYALSANTIVLEEPAAEVDEEPAPVIATGGDFPWLAFLVVAIILLALVVAVGLMLLLMRRAKNTECVRERRAWDDAKRRLATAREFLESQYESFNARMARVAEVETLLGEYQRALDGPTAGSGGLEFAKLDGELILVDGLRELIGQLESDLADAQSEATREKEELDRRLAQYTEAEAEESAARAAYEACMAASAAAAEAASGSGSPGSTPESGGSSAPAAVVTPPLSSTPRADCGCDPETATSPIAVPVGAAQRFRLFRDFDVISHVDEASQHGADKVGADMVTGLKDAGVALTTLGAALSGRGAALGGAKSFGSFQSGQFVKGSLQAVKGTVDGLGAMDVIPNVPTSLPEAVAQGLAATANLGAFAAGKVTEWMGKNTMVSVHASYYFQTVTIQPTQIWVCEDSVWQCKTKVNVYTVGTLERERGRDQQFTVKSDPERRTLRAHLATLASRGRSRITTSVQQIATWEAANPTGDCP